MRKRMFFVVLVWLPVVASSQLQTGRLNGSFESYSQLYLKDTAVDAVVPQDRVGSNNYLKLDYSHGKFGAGIQFEAYLPSIQGYPFNINEGKLVNKYISYSDENFSVLVGDFYEQFGSGMMFRAWENRQIGINNALEGVNIRIKPVSFLNIKALYGRQRMVFDYAQGTIRGVDAEFDLSQLSKSNGTTRVTSGLGFVSRYEPYTGPDPNYPSTVNAKSARLDINGSVASFSAEYVHKNKDPHDANNYDNTSGKALLTSVSVTKNNLGASLTLRTMENMDYRSKRDAHQNTGIMNYIPALTKQHDYLTTNIYVYNAQTSGEMGGQLDIFYNAPKNSFAGGKYGSKFALNFSHYRGLKDVNDLFSPGQSAYFHDLNAEWKKKWSERFTSILLYQNVFYNRLIIEGDPLPDVKTHTVVLNGMLRYAKMKSFRFELQHLFAQQDRGNWAAAVAEFSFAPKWSFFMSDLYNYGIQDMHYYMAGGSYTKGSTRFGLSYGRQRAGLLCVGGVCRYVPASTGITATLITTFSN